MSQSKLTQKPSFNLQKLGLAIAISAVNSAICYAAPQNGQVVGGDGVATIEYGTDTVINQSAQSATINWDSFNVESGESVNFTNPTFGSNFTTINNIGGSDPSSILGNVHSDGKLFLVNPNGFVFGGNSQINATSFLATTSNINLTDNTLTFTDNGAVADPSIKGAGSIEVTEGGFVALFAPNVEYSGNINLETGSAGVTLSDKTSGTLTLPGLNIGFDTTNLTSRSNSIGVHLSGQINANWESSKLEGQQVILSGTHIHSVIDNVVKLPNQLSTDHLLLDFQDSDSSLDIADDGDFTSAEVITLLVDQNLTIKSENINVNSSLNSNKELYTNRTLTFNADKNLTIAEKVNIIGRLMDLNLTANDSITSNSSLSSQKNSLTIKSVGDNGVVNLTGNTYAYESIYIESKNINIAKNNASDGDIYIQTTASETANSDIQINGTLSYDATKNASSIASQLLIESNTLRLGEISAGDDNALFNEIKLAGDDIYLSGDITSTSDISVDAISTRSNLYLSNSLTLSSKDINLNDSTLASNSGTDGIGLTLHGSSNINSIKLERIDVNPLVAATQSNISSLSSLTISGIDESTTTVQLSGQFDISDLDFGSADIRLKDHATFSNVNTLDAEHAIIQEDFEFTATGKAGSTATLGLISDDITLNKLNLSGFETVTLTKNITTSDSGLSISANNIAVNAAGEDVTITAQGSGNIDLNGAITGSNTSDLNFKVDSGNINFDSVNSMDKLSITRTLPGEGSTTIDGNLTAINTLTFKDAGAITLTSNATQITAGSLDFSGTTITSEATDTTFKSDSTASFNTITGNSSINIDALNISLSGNLTASKLNFVEQKDQSITLNGDVEMTGAVSFLNASTVYRPNIDGNYGLTLNTGTQDVTLYRFGSNTALSSLTVNGSGILTFKILDDEDTSDSGIPVLQGANGYTFTGGLSLTVKDPLTIDTSAYNGDIDFSGTTINGKPDYISLNAGSGDISLGDVGVDSKLPELNILSAGNVNLYGDILLTDSKNGYDFSNASAVNLFGNITLGNEEMPGKVNFGSATLDGTYTLTMYSNDITLGQVGQNIALQNLNIYSTGDLTLTENINLVGKANINANSLTLDNHFITTGGDLEFNTAGAFNMTADASLAASNEFTNVASNISITSAEGDVKLGTITAENKVTITATEGSIKNNIGDYITIDNNSVNITANQVILNAGSKIGDSAANPIVFNIEDGGKAELTSSNTIYVANLSSSEIVSTGDVVDSALGDDVGIKDALGQLTAQSLTRVNDPIVQSNDGLISNPTWQAEEDKSIRKLKTPVSAPAIKQTKNGWRLGSVE